MVADSVEFLRGAGPAGALRRRALLRRLQAQPRVHPARAGGGRRDGRRDARAVRHQRRLAAPRGRAHRRRGRRPLRRRRDDRHPPPRRHRLRRGQRAGRRARRRHAGAGHDQRLRRAHRQLQPHHDHPQPDAEDGRAHAPRRPPRAAHRGVATTSPSWSTSPPNPQQPYVGTSAFAHKAGLHVSRHRPAARRLRARRPRRRRQRHPLRRVGAGGQVDARAQGQGARHRPRRPGARARSSTSSSELEHEGYHFEAADGSLELLMRRRHGLGPATSSASSRSGSSPTSSPDGERRPPRRRSRCTSDGERRDRAPPRATAPSTPSTRRCAHAIGDRYPGARPRAPHRLQGARARHAEGHRRGHPGAASTPPTASASWSTIGVSENIIEASWQALSDSIVYGLLHAQRARTLGHGRARVRPRQPRRTGVRAYGLARPRARRRWTRRPPRRPRPGQPGGRAASAARAPTRATPSCWPGASTTASCWPTASTHDDAIAGCLGVALKRASLFGRAPVIHDLTWPSPSGAS